MYNSLIFEGGGMKAMCYAGALESLEALGVVELDKLRYYGGTSAGAIMATLLASGHTVSDICDIIYKTKWSKFKDGNILTNTIRLFSKFGFHKGNEIETFIDDLLFAKFGMRNITFGQMFLRTQKHLRMVGTNLTRGSILYMDHYHTPLMPVCVGVRISSCIPFVFKPVKYEDDLYVDGALIKNLDLDMFEEFETKTLALEISDKENLPIKNLATFGFKVFSIIYEEANRIIHNDEHIVSIRETKINPIDFKLKKEDLDYLREVGSIAVKDKFGMRTT